MNKIFKIVYYLLLMAFTILLLNSSYEIYKTKKQKEQIQAKVKVNDITSKKQNLKIFEQNNTDIKGILRIKGLNIETLRECKIKCVS